MRLLQKNVKLLRFLGRTKSLEMGKVIHARPIVSNHCSRDSMLKTDPMIAFHSRFAPMESASPDFDQMNKRKMVLPSASVSEHVQNGSAFDDLKLMASEGSEHMVFNKASYLGIFGLCGRLNYRGLGRRVHNKLLKSDVEFDVSVCNALLKMYAKFGDLGYAFSVLNAFEAVRNVVSYTTMMAAVSEQGHFEHLFIFCSKMQHDNINPNESVFSILLNASAELFSMTHGNLLHALAQKTGFKGHKKVEDALIDMYVRAGDVKAAEKVFLDMTTYRDIVTWNLMICGYSLHGFGNQSLGLFQEMLKVRVRPNHETFVGVLNACGRLGLVEEGLYYMYELMKEKGVKRGLDHYRCFLNILIRSGQLHGAFSYLESTRLKFDGIAWNALLNARDADRYDIISQLEKLGQLPDDVVMSVFGVASVREVLEKRSDTLNLEPGVSWVEVKRHIYICLFRV